MKFFDQKRLIQKLKDDVKFLNKRIEDIEKEHQDELGVINELHKEQLRHFEVVIRKLKAKEAHFSGKALDIQKKLDATLTETKDKLKQHNDLVSILKRFMQ